MTCISVIIPVYNMRQYLCQCLDSVICQTLKDIGIICINDGSTDDSECIIDDFRNRDRRIQLISQTNQGVATARNNGILAAKGEFVIFLDPDDYYPDENVLNDLYFAAVEHQVKICGGSFTEDRGTYITDEFTDINSGYVFQRDELVLYKDYQFDFGYHRFIYNREMLIENNIFYPNYERYEDPCFFVHAMVCAEKFYALKRPTYRYRYGYQNVKWDNRKVYDLLSAMRDILLISDQFRLYELKKLEIRRINEQFVDIISKSLTSKDVDIIKMLFEIEHLSTVNDRLEKGLFPLFIRMIEIGEEKETQMRLILNSRSYKLYNKMMNFIPRKLLEFIRNKNM